MSKRIIIIIGATGFIGKALCGQLVQEGYDVVALSRNPHKGNELLGNRVQVVKWDAQSAAGWSDYAAGAYAIINLAGENIAAGRWTRDKKQNILQSRLNAGRAVLEAVEQAKKKPQVVIQASAIGYYGNRGDAILDEASAPGVGFLPEVAQQWEQTTKKVASLGVRHIIMRSGIVLGRAEGFLPRVLLPFRLFVGGRLGSGKQWFSWIHIQDEVKAIGFLLGQENLHGVFNLTSPKPLTAKDFSQVLGKVMHRPSWLPVPGFALRLILGEMAKELILSGQRVMPKRLLEAGYEFLHIEAETALHEILKALPT
ncbi:TIGR01777 family protein [Candidatus Poribacteria bacterium]|nr:TIGR01777 family protein [Candidatus Poribacteria bacterium]